jgi:hypothetical protein
VRECIGPAAERIAFYNCVMDREVLDQLARDHAAAGHTLAEPPVGTLRARPNKATGMTGAEEFELTAREFGELCAVRRRPPRPRSHLIDLLSHHPEDRQTTCQTAGRPPTRGQVVLADHLEGFESQVCHLE